MHVVVEKQKITKYIHILEKVVGKQLNLEVLKCILIDASAKKLTLRATNLDIGIEATIPAEIKKQGIIAVPATTLSGFLENSVGEEVEFVATQEKLKAKSGGASVSINTVSHEDFPTLPKTTGKSVEISSQKIKEGFGSVWYAASSSSMKPELSSVFVSFNNKKIVFASTDSFRLAEKTIQTDGVDEFPTLLIPFKNVVEIIRDLDSTDENTIVKITASENQASFSFKDLYITTRLVDGTFPDYKQIIPKEHTTEVVVLKQDLLQALKVTNVFVNRFNQVTFIIDPQKKKFIIETTGAETGESSISLSTSLSGEPLKIGFNQKYITDSFQSIKGDSVTLQLSGVGKPMVIKSVSDPTFIYLTMPMSR